MTYCSEKFIICISLYKFKVHQNKYIDAETLQDRKSEIEQEIEGNGKI